MYYRRKFRSQTSDNMDRWKAEMGREEKKKEDQKRESLRRKKIQVREKRKVAKHCVFPMICGSRGSKSRLAKAAGAEPAGQMRDEKLHAVVARSTFASQNVQNTPGSDNFWMLRCRKSARGCGAKHISKSKCTKHTRFGPLLEVAMPKKCTPLWREAHFEVKMYKAHQLRTTFGSCDVEKVHTVVARNTFLFKDVKYTTCSDHFWTFRCRFAWQAQGIMHLVKSEQNVWVLSHFQKWWQAWDIGRASAKIHFRGRRSTRDMFIRDVRRSGRWFPEKGYILEHQIFSFGKMILRDRCSTSYDLASLFRGRRSTLDRWSANIAKRIGTRPSALHSTFHFWRKSRSIVSFLMLSTSKIEEVSQNCLFRFWCCQVQNWGSLAKKLRFQACR